jgi:hypothetical protein
MTCFRIQHHAARKWIGLTLAVWMIGPHRVVGATEDTFPVLRIGTRTYTNVTVTTKAKSYIFLLYDGGMTSIRTADLPPEVRQRLGYGLAGSGKATTNAAAVWAKHEIAKVAVPQVKELGKQLEREWVKRRVNRLSWLGLTGPTLNYALIGVGLFIYLFYCYCLMLICRKTGNPAGILIWVPVLQLFPMLRAAGMSGWWFLAYWVPVLNLVPVILWPLRIARARGKSIWVGILLLLPVTNVLTFLYLAFSNGVPPKEEEEPEPKVMTLVTA